jgi:hypothetical protein
MVILNKQIKNTKYPKMLVINVYVPLNRHLVHRIDSIHVEHEIVFN